MKTSETDRTPGAGRQPYLSAGIFSARSTILLPTNSMSETQSPRNPGIVGAGITGAGAAVGAGAGAWAIIEVATAVPIRNKIAFTALFIIPPAARVYIGGKFTNELAHELL